jgi:hypothetical protein
METAREQTTGGKAGDAAAGPRRHSGPDKGSERAPEIAKEPLQVRIPTQVKRQFKAAAAMRGLEPNELFVEVWEHYQRTRAE